MEPTKHFDMDGTVIYKLNGVLHREDNPGIKWANGDKWWWLSGMLHREDGPAIKKANGTNEWWSNGERHRLDGPAITWPDGTLWWFVNGKEYDTEFEYWIAVQKYVDTHQTA